MTVLFDEFHGQVNWGDTGYPSRRLSTTFAGVADSLHQKGYRCSALTEPLVAQNIETASAVVIPPPTGRFNSVASKWESAQASLLTGEEIAGVLSYLERGGRLLAFSYRFGDAFTKANLGVLFAALGWYQNDDAVIDLEQFGEIHPLHTIFETKKPEFDQSWALRGVETVAWRPVTSLNMLPNGSGFPIVHSPKSCVRIRLGDHSISHVPGAICVAGHFGLGKYILLGGPHAFEATSLGFLDAASNRQFLGNLLDWLFSAQDPAAEDASPRERSSKSSLGASAQPREQLRTLWGRACNASANKEKGEYLVDFVQSFLLSAGIFKPLRRSSWSLDREAEIDLVFECTSSKPLWTACRGLIPVECKNWINTVGSPEISRFAEKVERTSSKIGLFAARNYSEAAWSAVSKSRLMRSTIIGLLDEADFTSYLNGEAEVVDVVEASIVRSVLT